MTKKVLAIILALCLLVGCLPMGASATDIEILDQTGTCGPNLNFRFSYNTHTLTISGTGEMTDYSSSSYPWKNYKSWIEKIVVDNGVTSIGDAAFYNFTEVTNLSLPTGLTSIGDHTFQSCSSLTSITLPEGLTSIGDSAFYDCSFTKINVSSTVTDLKDLEEYNAFFTVASENQNYSADNKGVLFNKEKTKLIIAPRTLSGAYVVPDNVTSIGNHAFEECMSLLNITFPESLTNIGNYVFPKTDLTAVFKGNPPTTSSDAFSGTGSMLAYYPADNTNWTKVAIDQYGYQFNFMKWGICSTDGAVTFTLGTDGKLKISGQSKYQICDNAFQGFENIKSVEMSDGITIIGENMFRGCTSLSKISFPSDLELIYSSAFKGCSSLESLSIPDTVETIYSSAFEDCTSLKTVTIPAPSYGYGRTETLARGGWAPKYGISIDSYAFKNCTSLQTVTMGGIYESGTYYGCESIWQYAFENCTSLKTVEIPRSLRKLSHYAFYKCNKPDVYYGGTATNWNAITFYTDDDMPQHDILSDITIHYSTPSVTPNWSAVTAKASVPYGTKNKECFTTLPSTGTATIDDTTLNGTFSVLNGDTVQDCGERTVTVQFTVTSNGDYKGMTYTKDYTVTVAAKSVENSMISAIPTVTYNGAAHEPTLTVKNGTATLVKDTDYTVAYTNNTNAGTATATITGIGNYTGTASKNFTINKATITGYQTAAPTATILANDANNTADKLKTAANLPATVTVTYAGGTATLPITWADYTESYNAKGGSYTFKGTIPASDNFHAYTTPLTASLTVTAVNGTLNTTVPTSVVIAQNTAQNATSYADFKLPASIVIDCDNAVAQQVITPTWSVSLSDLKSKKVGSKTTVKVTNLPEWLTMSDVTVTVEITDKFPVTVTVDPISNVTYGTEIANPTATQTAIDNGTDNGATFTYTYTGTTASGTAYNSAVKPTEAGDYTVTATLVSNTHAGSGSTTFKILPKNLDNSMIGAIASVTYTGSELKPELTVTDGSVTLVKDKDFTVAYANNTAVGTATATITGKGNYSSTASKDFTIDPIDISAMTVKVEGTAEVEQALLASVEGVETVTFNWFVDGVQINNYTKPYLILTSTYEGKEITVSATASGNYTGTTAVSDAKTIAAATGDVVSSDVPEKAEITASTGNQQVTVKATAESEKPIALYAFKLCDSSDNAIKIVYSLTDFHTFTELTNGTEYHVSAVAFNVNGEGTWSDFESATPTAPSYSGGGSSGGSTDENDEPDVTIPLPNGSTVTIDKDDDGNVTVEVTNKDGEKVIEITIPSKPGSSKIFADVKNDAWYKNAVDKATGYGIFSGVSESKFAPKDSATRGMIAQTLYNLSGKTGYGTDNDNFSDSNGWYQSAVNWAATAGIVSGTGNGKFEPEEEITREQLVVMLYNFAQAIGDEGTTSGDLSKFTDSKNVSSWASEAMQWAVANGLMNGSKTANGVKLNPKDTATRAEVATVLVNFVEYLK